MALSNVRWKGMKAFGIMLDVLPTKIGGQKLREAYRFALKPTLNKMRENLPPNRTGALWYSTQLTILGTQELQQMYALVGPRRKRGVWNQQGWHAHLIEAGTKPHIITAGAGKLMPTFRKSGFTGLFAKKVKHSGTPALRPFQRAIDSTFNRVNDRVVDKVSEIMRSEIKSIFVQYGEVVTASGSVIQRR